MKTVELYARVRRAVMVDGMSRRAAAREFGLARKTVRKMLEYPVPPGYSVFDSAVYRTRDAKWLFHQEKATLRAAKNVSK